jgi:hypothetical protein
MDKVNMEDLRYLINRESTLPQHEGICKRSVGHYALHNKHISVDMCLYLLELCPDAARRVYRDGDLEIHRIFSCNRPEDDKKVLMEKLIELYPESVSIPNNAGHWPAHMAAVWKCQQCCIRLLDLNSEALQTPSMNNKGTFLDVSVLGLDILVFSMKTFPDHFTQIHDDGDEYDWTALHDAVSLRMSLRTGFAACTTRILMQFPAACRLKLPSTGNLPLHRLLFCQSPRNHVVGIDYLSSLARCVRLLVQLYPESVAVKNLVEKSPYDICVQNNHDLSIQRILLRAYPQVDYQRYCDLNYEARRMALFLSLMAFSFDRRPNIFRQLFCSNQDLLAHVCSFL